MKRKKFGKEDLIDILIKKASGFYYNEEIYEYEKTQNKSKNIEKQLNFFENSEIFKNTDRVNSTLNNKHDIIELSNEKNISNQQDTQELTLSKKKITTHYIPPDMFSIKILFEIFGKKVGDDIENMSDDELIRLKNKLIGEIINEDSKNIKKHKM